MLGLAASQTCRCMAVTFPNDLMCSDNLWRFECKAMAFLACETYLLIENWPSRNSAFTQGDSCSGGTVLLRDPLLFRFARYWCSLDWKSVLFQIISVLRMKSFINRTDFEVVFRFTMNKSISGRSHLFESTRWVKSKDRCPLAELLHFKHPCQPYRHDPDASLGPLPQIFRLSFFDMRHLHLSGPSYARI